jgi:hypothetical protein
VPSAVKILDFQMLHYGLPQQDLQYFYNCSGLAPEIRAKFETLLREDYYEELFRVLNVIESPFTREEYTWDKFLMVR